MLCDVALMLCNDCVTLDFGKSQIWFLAKSRGINIVKAKRNLLILDRKS